MKVIVFLVLSLLFLACHNQDGKQYPMINLESISDNNSKVLFSNIVDSIRYVALETNDSCLVAGNSSICGITEAYIYIRSASNIYQFGDDGRFIKEIGTLGRGPEEYPNIAEVKVHNRKIYVLTWGGEMVIYNENGDFLRKDTPESLISNFEIINDSIYVSEEKDYEDRGMRQYLVGYLNGKKHWNVLLQQDDLEIEQNYKLRGRFYTLNNIVYYKSLYSDTIYQIDNNFNPNAVKVFNYGKYSPERNMYENFKDRKNAINAGYIFNEMFFEAEKYWLVWSMMKDRYYLTIFDKDKNQIIYNQIPDKYPLRENGGIYDDITNIDTYFWPIYSFNDGVRFASLTNPSNYSEQTVEGLAKMNIVVDENSNPVVSICYFKY